MTALAVIRIRARARALLWLSALAAAASIALGASFASAVCFTPEELKALEVSPADRKYVAPLVVERSPWVGHYFTTEIARIVLVEMMGYEVIVQDPPNYTDQGVYERIATGQIDVNFETWPASAGDSQLALYVDARDAPVESLGGLGVVGQSAWWVPEYMMGANSPATNAFVDIGRAYGTTAATRIFPRSGSTPDSAKTGYGREFVPEWCALERNPPGCDLYGADFDARLCNVTVYSPYCMEMYAFDSYTDQGLLAQQIRNNRFNMTVVFLGYGGYDSYVSAQLIAQNPVLLYIWSPNPFLVRYNMRRVTLDNPTDFCYRNNTGSMAGFGSVYCDFQSQSLLKAMGSRLAENPFDDYADLEDMVHHFTLKNKDQTEFFTNFPYDDLTAWDDTARTKSCTWMKANTAKWVHWVFNKPVPLNQYQRLWNGLAGIGVFTCAAVPISVFLLLRRGNQFPLKFVNQPLAFLLFVGVSFDVQLPIISGYNPEKYPYVVFYWGFALAPALCISAVLAMWVNLYLTFTWRSMVRNGAKALTGNGVEADDLGATPTASGIGGAHKHKSHATAAAAHHHATSTPLGAASAATTVTAADPAPAGSGPLVAGSVAVNVTALESKTPAVRGDSLQRIQTPGSTAAAAAAGGQAKAKPATGAAAATTTSKGGAKDGASDAKRVSAHRVKTLARAQQLRSYTSTGWTIAICMGFFSIAVFFALVCFWGIPNNAVNDDRHYTGAGMSDPVKSASAFSTIFYCVFVCIAAYRLRAIREGIGLRRQVFVITFLYVTLQFVRMSLAGATMGPQSFHHNQGFYAVIWVQWIIEQMLLVVVVSLPALATYSWCESATTVDGAYELDDPECQIPLHELLRQKLGFRYYLLFSMLEFAEESVLCWKAIDSLIAAPTVAGALLIYNKFISEDSPLQVNISSANLRALTELVHRQNAEPAEWAAGFEVVSRELLALMNADTYGRFKTSSYFVRYLDGVPLTNKELYGKGKGASTSTGDPASTGPGGASHTSATHKAAVARMHAAGNRDSRVGSAGHSAASPKQPNNGSPQQPGRILGGGGAHGTSTPTGTGRASIIGGAYRVGTTDSPKLRAAAAGPGVAQAHGIALHNTESPLQHAIVTVAEDAHSRSGTPTAAAAAASSAPPVGAGGVGARTNPERFRNSKTSVELTAAIAGIKPPAVRTGFAGPMTPAGGASGGVSGDIGSGRRAQQPLHATSNSSPQPPVNTALPAFPVATAQSSLVVAVSATNAVDTMPGAVQPPSPAGPVFGGSSP